MARALLREPDLVNRMAAGEADAGICIHCNRCMPTIYSGTRCTVIDPGGATSPRRSPAARAD
jgi:2,4-dienoyl-CoA reductase-like NADH-dependent reductase (Old Yellow Enzyme family)